MDFQRDIIGFMDAPKRRHTEQILLRFEPDQLALIDEAASQASLNRTAWLRMTALRVAREEVGRYPGAGKAEEEEPAKTTRKR